MSSPTETPYQETVLCIFDPKRDVVQARISDPEAVDTIILDETYMFFVRQETKGRLAGLETSGANIREDRDVQELSQILGRKAACAIFGLVETRRRAPLEVTTSFSPDELAVLTLTRSTLHSSVV